MGKYAQLIMGPAGSGKSTFCNTIRLHCENSKRTVHCVNLDPSAEVFDYPISVDIRELISVDEVMEELGYGPNGGLIYAMEFLLQNVDWLEDQLGDFDDDYLLIDCPGQIELYSHMDVMKRLVDQLNQWGYSVCAVYLLDSHFVIEPSKFIAGTKHSFVRLLSNNETIKILYELLSYRIWLGNRYFLCIEIHFYSSLRMGYI